MVRDVKPSCEKCKSKFVYVRSDDSVKCRRCGHVTIKKELQEKPKLDINVLRKIGENLNG